MELLGTPSLRSMTVGETKGAGEETELNIPDGLIKPGPGLELTPSAGTVDGLTETEEDDWVGRLAAGSVELRKMVEVTVIMTGPPAAGSVGCGIPPEIEEEVEEGSTEGMEEGSSDGVASGSLSKVGEGGSTEVVEEGKTMVDLGGVPLERVTLLPSNSASLRERSECPSPLIWRAHQIPT